jgi:hypothetical protein
MQLLQGGIKNKLFGSYILFFCASLYFFILFSTDNSLIALLFLTAYYSMYSQRISVLIKYSAEIFASRHFTMLHMQCT